MERLTEPGRVLRFKGVTILENKWLEEVQLRLDLYEDTGYSPEDFGRLCRDMSILKSELGPAVYEDLHTQLMGKEMPADPSLEVSHKRTGRGRDCCEDAFTLRKKSRKRKTGLVYRRAMEVKHRDDLMRILNYGYKPHAGYVDWDYIDGVWQRTGGYIKYPKNSNKQRYLKRYSNKIVRRSKEVGRGGQYKKHFDYWWEMY